MSVMFYALRLWYLQVVGTNMQKWFGKLICFKDKEIEPYWYNWLAELGICRPMALMSLNLLRKLSISDWNFCGLYQILHLLFMVKYCHWQEKIKKMSNYYFSWPVQKSEEVLAGILVTLTINSWTGLLVCLLLCLFCCWSTLLLEDIMKFYPSRALGFPKKAKENETQSRELTSDVLKSYVARNANVLYPYCFSPF